MNTHFVYTVSGKQINELITSMSQKMYKFQETENRRWGIYYKDRLLATVGKYEICESIDKCLENNLSAVDSLKATLTYQKSLNRSLTIK